MKTIFIGLCIFWALGFLFGIVITPQYQDVIGKALVGSLIAFGLWFFYSLIKAQFKK